ncbi:MAG: hypothetical protein COV29_02530 [Candidatus Yanofskybacteria bacterium CG10_big_fil_rev_8_21_14_0_10_36_16]|uniref:Uncharacterized protein n=1 Tax=Candidatus Yanofskybacteria bacterium CG10_big_fil_rev_8_21_14_0_10_36_16 TaxID=1975096 RepID=A0A2J0Q7R4_9BACT|nr:MAG: hypothetical protein COV29_02530 [Candidatus Yanofskybacteria bacterium CG10_big_fil_rev_8_21_14_0_10_36_16]
MAVPENRKHIATNLPFSRLNLFLDALEADRVKHVPGSKSAFAEALSCEFDFEDARYEVNQFDERVNGVYLKSGNPTFIRVLINELETELFVVVKERSYDEAKEINEKIESLMNILKAS